MLKQHKRQLTLFGKEWNRIRYRDDPVYRNRKIKGNKMGYIKTKINELQERIKNYEIQLVALANEKSK